MKVQFSENNVLGTGGLGTTQSFQIRTNAHAFKMLSSGLYSDKIGAVLREIGCNAHDAHIQAGKAHLPFEVKLPNFIDNQFWIKDFGPGLSYDEVMNLYTTYFASTKQDSDDFTGGFGLGSKSPFSYTDAFTITSCHGGKSRIFTAHIGNDGSPKIAQMGETDTTETGIKISFPVRNEDFKEFQTKAQNKFQFFKPLPVILGGDDIKAPVYSQDTGSYAIYKEEIPGTFLQMGNVIYPIDPEKLKGNGADVILGAYHYPTSTIVVRLPIGKVNVSGSRESIQYDTSSIKILIEALTAVAKDVVIKMHDKFMTCKTWEAKCNLRKEAKIADNVITLSPELFKTFGFIDGEAIIDLLKQYVIRIPIPPPLRLDMDIHTYSVSNNGRLAKESVSYSEMLYLRPDDKIAIVRGGEKFAAERIKKALLDGKFDKGIYIRPQKDKVVLDTSIDEVIKAINKLAGEIPLIPLHTLERPKIVRSTSKASKIAFPDGEIWPFKDGKNKILASTVPIENCVYLKKIVLNTWGRTSKMYDLGPDFRQNDANHVATVTQMMERLNDIVAYVHPYSVPSAEVRRTRMYKNPDWTPYGVYIVKVLTDPAVIKYVTDIRDKFKPTLQLTNNVGYMQSPLEILVMVRNKHLDVFNAIKPSLLKNNVLDEVEEVHKLSKAKNATREVPPVIVAYNWLVGSYGDKAGVKMIDVMTKTTSALEARFNVVDGALIDSVATISPAACIQLLTELIQ